MQNLDLTKWLEMVWDALAEEDEKKRDSLLHTADMFLKQDNPDSAPRWHVGVRRRARPFKGTQVIN